MLHQIMIYLFDHTRYCADIILDAQKREPQLEHCFTLVHLPICDSSVGYKQTGSHD